MSYSRQVIQLAGNGDSPWVPVIQLRQIQVAGGERSDVIELRFKEHDLHVDPDPIRIRGDDTVPVIFPRGKVQVVRIAGKNALSVYAHCVRKERSHAPSTNGSGRFL